MRRVPSAPSRFAEGFELRSLTFSLLYRACASLLLDADPVHFLVVRIAQCCGSRTLPFPLFDTWIGRLRVMRGVAHTVSSTHTVSRYLTRLAWQHAKLSRRTQFPIPWRAGTVLGGSDKPLSFWKTPTPGPRSKIGLGIVCRTELLIGGLICLNGIGDYHCIPLLGHCPSWLCDAARHRSGE